MAAQSSVWRLGVTGGSGSLINTTLRVYDDGATAVFAQFFSEALEYMAAEDGDTSAGVTDMATAFPSFQPASNTTPLWFQTLCGAALSPVFGAWGDIIPASSACGMPLVLFSGAAALVAGPAGGVAGFQGASVHLGGARVSTAAAVTGMQASSRVDSMPRSMPCRLGMCTRRCWWRRPDLRSPCPAMASTCVPLATAPVLRSPPPSSTGSASAPVWLLPAVAWHICRRSERVLRRRAAGCISADAPGCARLRPAGLDPARHVVSIRPSTRVAVPEAGRWYDGQSCVDVKAAGPATIAAVLQWTPEPQVAVLRALAITLPHAQALPGGWPFLSALDVPLWLATGLLSPLSNYTHSYAVVSDPDQHCFVLPVEPAFYAAIMRSAAPHGMVCWLQCRPQAAHAWQAVFVQDLLADATLRLNASVSNVTLVPTWLASINSGGLQPPCLIPTDRSAALQARASVLLGQPLPTHLIASAPLAAVALFEVSQTYHAVRVTSVPICVQSCSGTWAGAWDWGRRWPCCRGWGRCGRRATSLAAPRRSIRRALRHCFAMHHVCRCYEPNPELLVLVAVLACGPVLVGDGLGWTDAALVAAMCCAAAVCALTRAAPPLPAPCRAPTSRWYLSTRPTSPPPPGCCTTCTARGLPWRSTTARPRGRSCSRPT